MLEADIEACFDEISHTVLRDRIRRRIGDKRVLALVKAFLKAGHPHASNAMGNFCFEVTLGYWRLEKLPRVESGKRHDG
ncbi:hypothetical protein AB0P37_45370 [Streptomyces antimycoticus]|uniref:hypothetical protein n=1 Tax=Streptomyces antimycoticus TaxID=68175 RepID=UPI00342E46E8